LSEDEGGISLGPKIGLHQKRDLLLDLTEEGDLSPNHKTMPRGRGPGQEVLTGEHERERAFTAKERGRGSRPEELSKKRMDVREREKKKGQKKKKVQLAFKGKSSNQEKGKPN